MLHNFIVNVLDMQSRWQFTDKIYIRNIAGCMLYGIQW